MNEEKITVMIGDNPTVENILQLQEDYTNLLINYQNITSRKVFHSVDEVLLAHVDLDEEIFIYYEVSRKLVDTTKRKVLEQILKGS